MLHSKYRHKDIKKETINDWTGLNETSLIWYMFYPITDLKKDGFIYPDGSLRFEYKVEKRNL